MISLIILAYNDAQSLGEIIPEWIVTLDQQDIPYEIIVTDDGSTDETKLIMPEFVRENQKIKYIRSEMNHGVGANFKMGVEYASGDLIAYTDGDGQYLPSDFLVLLKDLDQNHMITGRRINRADPFLRSVTSTIYNFLVRIIYPVHIRDINSGLKIFKRTYIENCLPQFSDGPFFDAEYLIKGCKQGMLIKEMSINHRPRKYGRAAGISMKNLRQLFTDVCHQPMKPFTRKNYFSRVIFRLLAT